MFASTTASTFPKSRLFDVKKIWGRQIRNLDKIYSFDNTPLDPDKSPRIRTWTTLCREEAHDITCAIYMRVAPSQKWAPTGVDLSTADEAEDGRKTSLVTRLHAQVAGIDESRMSYTDGDWQVSMFVWAYVVADRAPQLRYERVKLDVGFQCGFRDGK